MGAKGKRIAIIGSVLGGGAAQIIDALRGTADSAVAIFDSDMRAQGSAVFVVPVVGSSDLSTITTCLFRGAFDAAVVAIGGDLRERERVFLALRDADVPLTNVIDPTVQLRSRVVLGTGNVLLGGVYLGPGVEIGDNCYLVNYASVQHDSIVGSHSYMGTGATVSGKVTIGRRVRFDVHSGARARIVVGDDCTVAAWCVLTHDLPSGSIAEAAEYMVTGT